METTQTYSYCLTRNSAGIVTSTFVFITAIDIRIDKTTKWSYDLSSNPIPTDSTRYDFKSTLLHELGHGVGLDHVADSTKLMYPYLAPSQQTYYLSTEPELNGGANILRRSILATRCFAPMIPLDTTATTGNWAGAQITLNPFRFLVDPCKTAPVTYTATASGATTYKWYPAASFGGTNPITARVSFSSTAARPYVYGMKDGLGDLAFTRYKVMPCSFENVRLQNGLRTQVYPNPSSSTFTVAYSPAVAGVPLLLTLYNAQGTVLHTRHRAAGVPGLSQVLELPQLPAGTYFLRTEAAGQATEVVQLQAQ